MAAFQDVLDATVMVKMLFSSNPDPPGPLSDNFIPRSENLSSVRRKYRSFYESHVKQYRNLPRTGWPVVSSVRREIFE